MADWKGNYMFFFLLHPQAILKTLFLRPCYTQVIYNHNYMLTFGITSRSSNVYSILETHSPCFRADTNYIWKIQRLHVRSIFLNVFPYYKRLYKLSCLLETVSYIHRSVCSLPFRLCCTSSVAATQCTLILMSR